MNKYLKRIKKLNVLLIGDTIIDEYVFVSPKGRAMKDPILSVEYKNKEIYPGGILAIANHLSDFVNKIKIITLLGNNLDGIILKNNIKCKAFTKEKSTTTIKKRFIDYYRKHKLFKIEYLDDKPISKKLTKKILGYLDEELSKYDLILVGDFGHGFINPEIRRKLEATNFLAINVQTNSSNIGFNFFNLYRRFDYMVLNELELRMPLSLKFEDITEVIKKSKLRNVLITLGEEGNIFVNSRGKTIKHPAFTKSIKDTMGTGDVVFGITSLFNYIRTEDEDKLIPFIANCVGSITASTFGNKDYLTRGKLIKFIKNV